MKVLNLRQGSPEWKAHRATAYNASDAPAMLGINKYKSRNDLIKERATGIVPEVDAATQFRFNDGHRFEALARPLAEEIIGEELSPITGADGKYSASFDGITFDGSVIFEHKTMNANLREDLFSGATLDEQYRVQMEHQLMVSGAKKCLFMATTWDKDDKLVEEMHCWYMPDPELRKRIGMGWIQFKADVAAYVPTEVKEVQKAEAIIALPSVFVQATGMVTASNLAEFKEAATTFIANIKTELVSDQDFADAESTVKFCKDAEGNLESTKASVLAQMSTVDEVVRTLDHIAAQLRDKRLMLEKLVKSEKEARKLAIVNEAAAKLTDHVQMLEEEIKPIRLSGAQVKNSFADAIKGKKSLSSMQDAVDTALANIKIALDTEAADIRKKLAWCKESSAGFGFLFSDLASLIANNGMEAFQAIVNGRIAQHKADEAAKEEATRLRIQQEEEAKAQAKAKAEQDAIVAKAQAEEREKARAEAVELANREQLAKDNHQSEAVKQDGVRPALVQTEPAAPVVIGVDMAAADSDKTAIHYQRPSRHELLLVIGDEFDVSEQTALEWIIAEFAGDIQFEGRKAV